MTIRRRLLALFVVSALSALSCGAAASPPPRPADAPPAAAAPEQADAGPLQADAGPLQADAGPEQAAGSLAGTSWTVTAYNNGKQAVVSVITGTEISATFGNDGRVVGRAGCNRYFAAYRIQGRSLSVDAPGATRMHCGEPAGVMEQEQLYLAALQSATELDVEGDVLTLRAAGGETAVTLGKTP